MDNKSKVASVLLKLAKEIASLDYDYKYDPDHKKNPGAGYTKTDKGWAKGNQPASPPRKPKIDPKHFKKPDHTHSFGKLNPSDEDETRVRVYDSGEKGGLDNMTAVVDGKDWDASVGPGQKTTLCFSGDGGLGVSQWTSGIEGKHLGKPIKWEELSEENRKHIERRIRNSGS